VAGRLSQRLKKRTAFPSPHSEAMLNLLAAADEVRRRIQHACGTCGLTQGQYNVLRILRGACPKGHPRGEIASRMIERAPDVTRIVDRLEAQGLVERTRSEQDRRVSVTRITPRGLALLDELDPHVAGVYGFFAERVSERDCRTLTRICEKIYADEA